MNQERRVEIWAAVALAVFAFVNVLAWAFVIPLGDAPDESTHFVVVAFELVFRAIPEVGVDDDAARAVTAVDGFRSPLYTYSAQPGLSYIVSAATIHFLAGDSAEPARYARFPGALWGALLVLVTYRAGRRILPTQPGSALLAAAIVAFWPQLAFVFSYINNDGLTVVVCAALIASWYEGVGNGWRNRDVALTAFLAGLALLNKPNGFPVAGVAAIVMVISLGGAWSTRVRKLGLAGVVCATTAGWWYWIAYQRYGWDLLGEARADAVRRALGVQWPSGRYFGKSLLETAIGPFPRYGETWLQGTLRTAAGAFSNLTVALPTWAYWLMAAFSILGAAGAVFGILRAHRRFGRIELIHVITVGLIPLEAALALYRSWAFDFQAQGRYLFPVMLPFVMILAYGLLVPFRGWMRSLVGFSVTTCFAFIMTTAFTIVLLGAYRSTMGDLISTQPLIAAGWIATLLLSLALSALAWLRNATVAAPDARSEDLRGE